MLQRDPINFLFFSFLILGNNPPPKPWERSGSASGPAPFRPPSNGNTSDVVEASGTAKPGEVVSTVNRTTAATSNTLSRPVPPRPWEQNYGSSYGGSVLTSDIYYTESSKVLIAKDTDEVRLISKLQLLLLVL